jgi:hypothetical protein
MKDTLVIGSVLGFDLSMELLLPEEGKILRGGIRSSVYPTSDEDKVHISKDSDQTKWFTNYNHSLLEKIRDYQNRNA